jgi:hypothetical protein
MGMNWIVALVLCAIGGILGGMFMGMGGAWIAAVIAMSALAVIVQVIIMLAGAFS